MTTTLYTDILIVGGGPAGVAAAVAASSQGLKVLLAERNLYLGGKATAAEVGTVCGLYKFSKNMQAEYIVNGFTKKFGETLRERSGSAPLYHPCGLHYLPYDIGIFKNLCAELLDSNNVDVHFCSELTGVEIYNSRIESVQIQKGDNSMRVFLRSIIDCSGESIVSRLACLPLIKSDQYQAAAQVFTVGNVKEHSEASLGMILKRELQIAIEEKKLESYYDRVNIVPGSAKNGQVSLKIGIPLPVTHTPENLVALKRSAHLFVQTLTGYLVSHVSAFKKASLLNIAPEVGIRVAARSAGKYILTEEDVLNCKKSCQAIANVPWPIEEWEQDKRVKMRYFNLDDFYQVPAGCLQSGTVENLFMAGRNISATDGAIASARVIGTCLQTGYAAGLMAAGSASCIPETETIKNIQNGQL